MKKLILTIAVLTTAHFAQAAEDYAGNVGVAYGLSVPDYSGTTSRSIMGLQGTAKLGSEWGLGAYYLTSGKSESSNNLSGDFNYQLYGIKGTYHFEGDARGVYFGALLGISKVHITNYDTSPTHYGILGGYDHMLGSMISIGGELSYIAVGSSSTTYNAQPYDQKSFNTLNFMAELKFWF